MIREIKTIARSKGAPESPSKITREEVDLLMQEIKASLEDDKAEELVEVSAGDEEDKA